MRIYACGPTVYGPIHVGNARFFVVFSLLKRFLVHEGYVTTFVTNITDINDKIYLAARAQGVESARLAEEMTAAYLADTDALGLGRPDAEPLASQVRISPDGATAYIGNQDAGTITFLDVASGQPFDTVAVDGSVLTIGLRPDGRRLYALTDYYGVYVIDVASRSVIDSIPPTLTGALLTGVAFHPSAPRMYIAARDAGTVTVIDTRSDFVLTSYAVNGGRTQNVAVAKDGSELYATDIERSGLVIWNLKSGSAAYQELLIGSGQVRNAFDVAVTPDDAQLYVTTLADGKVYVLDRAQRMVVDSIVTGGSPRYVGFDADGTHAVIPNEGGWVDFVR